MYEDQTKAAILQRMLDASPDDIDKREGSPTFDLLSPAAIELALAYIELDNVLAFGFADTTYGEYLDRRAAEAGLTRKEAQKAAGAVKFTGEAGFLIPKGTQVATRGIENDSAIYFETVADVTVSAGGSATVGAVAVNGGTAGNVVAGEIRRIIGNLAGVTSVTNEAPFEGGTETESDAALLRRYRERLSRPATSGNANQYRQWAIEVAGISDAQVYPIWAGPGTVKVVLINDEKRAPSPALVDDVEAHIMALAPIGADVTVEGAQEVAINVAATYTLVAGATIDDARTQILAGLTAYLQSLAFADPIVRYSRIANVILDAPAIIDYDALTVNGGTTNITIPSGSVAVAGAVS